MSRFYLYIFRMEYFEFFQVKRTVHDQREGRQRQRQRQRDINFGKERVSKILIWHSSCEMNANSYIGVDSVVVTELPQPP